VLDLDSEERRLGYFLASILALVWGLAFPLTKEALDYASPMVISLFRVCFAAAILWPLSREASLDRDAIVGGLLNVGLFLVFLNLSVMYSTDPGLSSVLIYTEPIFLVILERVFMEKRLGTLRIFGLILGTSGMLLAVAGSGPVSLEFLGDVFGLMGGLSWAAGTAFYEVRLSRKPLLSTNASMNAASVPLLMLCSLVDFRLVVTPVSLTLLFAIALAVQVGGFLLFFKSISLIEPARASSVLMATPLVALISSWALFGMGLGIVGWVGAGLTILGVLIVIVA